MKRRAFFAALMSAPLLLLHGQRIGVPKCWACSAELIAKPAIVASGDDACALDGSMLPPVTICVRCGIWQTPPPIAALEGSAH